MFAFIWVIKLSLPMDKGKGGTFADYFAAPVLFEEVLGLEDEADVWGYEVAYEEYGEDVAD